MNVRIFINHFLPRLKGPGFISNPDIIKSVCVTLDKTNMYDNIMKHSIVEFVFNLFPKLVLLLLHINFLPLKEPILDLY